MIETADADRDLVARILGGSDAARDELFVRHRQRLLLTASSLMGYQDPEAEDMVHEAVLAGLKDLDRFEFRASLNTWLTHICVNLCLKALRRRSRMVVEADEAIEQFCNADSRRKSPAGGAQDEQKERLGQIRQAMQRLKAGCREILALRYDGELEYGAIAARLKVPIGTVMSRLARCRTVLKEMVLSPSRANDHG